MLLGQVRNVFLTHLHSDHIIGLPDLYLTGWGAQGRKTPFRVWGPSGTKEMMEHLQKAFDFDIRIRRDIDEKFVKEGIEVSSTDIKEGVIFQDAGVEPASRSHVAGAKRSNLDASRSLPLESVDAAGLHLYEWCLRPLPD